MSNTKKTLEFILDPGHGGKDPGAIGHGLREKDVVLSLALQTGKYLETYGAKVHYTRKTDVFLSLEERAEVANKLNADYFYSFHTNAFNQKASGYESYIHSTINGGATAAYQNVIHRRVASQFTKEGIPDRGQKKANYAVLRLTNMPACLGEYGFIDHAKDAALLKNPVFIDLLAAATARGIAESFGLKKEEPVVITPSEWAKDAQSFVKSNGISDGTRPNELATREEVWVMLYKLYLKLNDKPSI